MAQFMKLLKKIYLNWTSKFFLKFLKFTSKQNFIIKRQEGVAIKIYQRFLVEIINIADNSIVQCYTYDKFNKHETNGKPSPAYKNVIINGAKEVGLPENYIQYLRSFEDNGYKGAINVDIPMEFILSS